jgi:hypothetical protein
MRTNREPSDSLPSADALQVLLKTLLFPYLVTSAPEDGNSMFLRNVGIDLQIYTALKPQTYTTIKGMFATGRDAVCVFLRLFCVYEAVTESGCVNYEATLTDHRQREKYKLSLSGTGLY